MRVLHVVNEFLPFTRAGTELYLAALLQAQATAGAQAMVLQLMPVSLQQERGLDGFAIQRGPYAEGQAFMLARPPRPDLTVRDEPLAAVLKPWLASLDVDVVHIHSLIGYSVSLLDAVPARAALLMTLHDFWLPCANAILVHSRGEMCSGPESEAKCAECVMLREGSAAPELEHVRERTAAHRVALQRLDAAICPSRFSLRFYRRFGFAAPGLQYAPLGMSPLPRLEREPSDVLRFACLGGVNWFKGQDLAVAAFLALGLDNARLDIHGVVSNEVYFEQLRELGSDAAVHWHGGYGRQDLPAILAACDVLLLPSRIESYSFVAREALSAGVPVIAADCAALPEVVRHGMNGLLFRSGDAADLALQMARVAREPELLATLRAGMGQPASLEEDTRRLLALYGELMDGRRGAGHDG